MKQIQTSTELSMVSCAREGIVTPMPRFSGGVFSFGMMTMLIAMLMVVLLGAMNAHANDHRFSTITDDSLSSGFQLQGHNSFVRNPVHIETTLQADTSPAVDNLDSVTTGYQSQGFKVGRISASWKTKAGVLTVGNDWANFQDILSVNKGFESIDISAKKRTVSSQIKWLSANGFSISLEDAPKTSSYSTDDTTSNSSENTVSPGLILSWQGGPGGVAGDYRVTAMGRKLDATTEGQKFDSSNLTGWGLNVEGGWQIDDLFATLSVTYGKGIDSYILQRYGDNLVVTPNYSDEPSESGATLSIRPSLYYSLNDNSNFHVSLGYYTAKNSFNNSGIDTLDTINMGYSWSPWPSTKLGFELVGQNPGGRDSGGEESAQVKFDAQKRF